MKIGLIGINMYPKYLNFACGLHTYAFQQFLLQQGIETTVIDYKPVYFGGFDLRHPADYYKKRYERRQQKAANTQEEKKQKAIALQDLQEKIDDWEPLYKEREIRYDKFRRFIDQYYIKTEEQYDSDLLEIKDPGFDCYICVTDVIWNLIPTHMFDRGFLLGSKAMEGKQKISYAASRGVPKPYTQEEKDLFFYYINDIDEVSVREKSLKEFIEENSEKKAELVLDPVMLHDKAFWQKLSIKPKEQGYILLYYVMGKAADTIKQAVEYAKKHNLLIVELSDRPVKSGRVKDSDVRHIARYDVGMEEWLGYIEYADCIFTNSFHGCCFSILFEKLFYVGKRKGDKVTNILDVFRLQHLRMPDKSELEALAKQSRKYRLGSAFRRVLGKKPKKPDVFDFMPETVDYTDAARLLEKRRAESKAFILDAVKRAEKRFSRQEQKDRSGYDAYRRRILYPIHYFSSKAGVVSRYDEGKQGFHMEYFSDGTMEYSQKGKLYKNDETEAFEKNGFHLDGCRFAGWRLRIKIDTRWFWYMEDGRLDFSADYDSDFEKTIMLFDDVAKIPHIPVNHIRIAIAEAVWEK